MSFDTILAKSPFIIFQPGGTPSGLIVTTWDDVQQFISYRQGAVTVFVDDSFVSPALVPGATGITECEGRVVLDVYAGDSDIFSVLQIEDGATLNNVAGINVLEVRCNCQSATPSMAWTLTPNGGLLAITGIGRLSNASTATNPAIVLSGSRDLFLDISNSFLSLHASAVPLISVGAGSTLEMDAYDGSVVDANFASGAGDVELVYDNATASFFATPGVFPPLPGISGTYTPTNVDSIWVNKVLDPMTMGAPAIGDVPTFDGTKWKAQAPSGGVSVVTATFLASAVNALAAMQGAGQLPSTGIIPVRVEGFGGGGGAPGNQGGSPTAGGGGGGAQYQSSLIYIDLSHTFDVTIGAGGLGSLGTPNGSGLSPNDGGAGGFSELADSTSGLPIWGALGANGATAVGSATGFSGQAGGSQARADFGPTQPVPNVSQSGAIFPLHYLAGSGGHPGANAGVPGSAGSPAIQSVDGLWVGGTGGVNGGAGVNTDGHGGGGGAAGPRGNGGAAGNGTPVGSNLPGGNGTSAGANTGAGGGAGGGGPNGGTQNGSNGGDGGSGWMRMTFFVSATIVS